LYSGVGFLLLIILLFAWFAKDLPSPNKINARTIAQSTRIFDRQENLLYEIHGDKKRTLIDYNQMPQYIKDATVAIEDKDFYKHHGFDIRGITRAGLYNITHKQKMQGGSTITQQFVKNAILTPERTFSRKIKELILSIEIEMIYSKEDILKMYLNEIPYGSNAYGIEAAAQTFFGKKAKDLNLSECALLAALPRAPTYYSPFGTHTDELEARKNIILDKMAELGYITSEQAQGAKAEKLVFLEQRENIKSPHFVMFVREQLVEKYGEKMVEEGGLVVTTTLDPQKQAIAEEVVTTYGNKNRGAFRALNAALVSIDPKTGQILAMVGSRDYWNKDIDGNVNVTTRDRQPGSSIKPYIYATAFGKGYLPETTLFDLNTDFGNNYKPKNYDLGQRGPVSMRTALACSLNIPAVKTLYLVGMDDALKTAHAMGITTLNEPSRYGLSLVLGGGEVKLLDHTAAMSTFATEGVKNEKTPILKIEDSKGKVLEEYKDKGEKVLDENVARAINDLLSDNNARAPVFGSSSSLRLSRPAAAKTGTTEEFRDAWTVGYTPNLSCGVWAGNNDNSVMRSGADGVYVAAPIWHEYMERALSGMPSENFNRSYQLKGHQSDKKVIKGQTGKGEKIKICTISGKRATDQCPSETVQEKEFSEAHCILYYVDKSNPLGPVPKKPQDDPQFLNWETPVKSWAYSHGGGNYPPGEYCDLHTEGNKPSISITSPANASTVSNPITITTSVSAPLGVNRVEFYFDSILIATDFNSPFETAYITTASGVHNITARVYDKGNYSAEDKIKVKVSADTTAPTAPAWLTATAISQVQINLSWGPSTDDVGVDGYKIERSMGGPWVQIAATSGTSYSDTGLLNNTTYSYRVRAYDAAGNNSNYSPVATATTFP
jgi:1A family penicillin-binding protein